MTLVAALMLTIPFSLVGAFTNGFWDNLESALAACTTPVNVTLGTLYDQYFKSNAVRHGACDADACATWSVATGAVVTALRLSIF